MTKLKLLAAAATALALCAGAAQAVVIETTNFIPTPTYFNGFEGIGATESYTGPYS